MEIPYKVNVLTLIEEEVTRTLNSYLFSEGYITLGLSEVDVADIHEQIRIIVLDDLAELASKDPAAQGREDFVLLSYISFRAVMFYRIANVIYYNETINEDFRKLKANQIANFAKSQTSVDIHPGAKIGKHFVIDHGSNTKISETAEIGENCYLLQGVVIGETCDIGENCCISQGVVLGARDIGGNPIGKRHPTLGNYVEVAGCARIFGNVKIDDYVKIAAHCVIDFDITNPFKNNPDETKRWLWITITNQLQFSHPSITKKIDIYGMVPKDGNQLCILGNGFTNPRLRVLDENHQLIPGIEMEMIYSNSEEILIRVIKNGDSSLYNINRLLVCIQDEGEVIYIANSLALSRMLKRIS